MAWFRPTPKDILKSAQVPIDTDLPGGDARVRRSPENVLARIIAMAAHEFLGFIAYIAKQILVSTADEEHLPRHGSEWGIGRKAAEEAGGPIQFVGVNGSIILQGSILKRSDNVEFSLDADVTIAAGTGIGNVTCLQASASGNAAAGTKLALTSPVPGVTSEATVQAPGLSGGADIEDLEEWRARIIKRKQRPPQGGSANDYETWATEVSGVTRAWCYPKQTGVGTVSVSFVMDNRADIIPTTDEVAAVQMYINTKRPVTPDVTVFAPTATPIAFAINLRPNTAAVRAAVKAELEDLFKREAIPGGTIYLSRIREAVSLGAGEFDNVVAVPNANIVAAFGDLPVIGVITFGGI